MSSTLTIPTFQGARGSGDSGSGSGGFRRYGRVGSGTRRGIIRIAVRGLFWFRLPLPGSGDRSDRSRSLGFPLRGAICQVWEN